MMNEKTLDTIATVVATSINEAVGPLAVRLADLEQQIASLAAKPHLKFCGVYQSGRSYQPGDAVTRSGSLWVCNAATTGEPGQDFGGWQLGVKRGKA